MPRPPLCVLAVLLLIGSASAQPGDSPEKVPEKKVEKKTERKAPAKAEKKGDARTQEQKDRDAEAGAAVAAGGLTIMGMGLVMFIVVALVSLLFYFLPTFVAMVRRHENAMPIALINFFLGWSFIGWIVALAWSFTSQQPRYRRRYED
jgi:hypothetical protein